MRPTFLLVALLTGCSTQTLPPPAAPAKEMALAMPADPPPPGSGRVLVDVVGEHASVERLRYRVDATVSAGMAYQTQTDAVADPICTTPCVVDLPIGSHELRFKSADGKRTSTDFVVTGPRPSVFRHVPEELQPRKAVQILGGTAIGLGASFGLIGGILVAAQKDDAPADRKNALVGFTAACAGVLAVGVLALILFPPKYRAGASRQWEVR